jgi:hypothetical protein
VAARGARAAAAGDAGDRIFAYRVKVNLTACQNSPPIWFDGTSQSLLL